MRRRGLPRRVGGFQRVAVAVVLAKEEGVQCQQLGACPDPAAGTGGLGRVPGEGGGRPSSPT